MASTGEGEAGGAAVLRAPDPRLRSHVARDYQGWTMRADRTDRFVVPAHTAVQLVVKVDDSDVRPPEFVHGAAARHAAYDGGCAPRYVQVELTPLGAYQVLGVPMHHLGERLTDLTDVVGDDSRRLGDTIRAAGTWQERFDAVDRFLIARAGAAPAVTDHVAYAWGELTRSGGAVPIGAISDEVGWSHKHLITRFREQVGLTPKRAARVIRFEGVLRRLDGSAPPDWARLAVECGYADQSHLIREFTELAGSTPASAVALAAR